MAKIAIGAGVAGGTVVMIIAVVAFFAIWRRKPSLDKTLFDSLDKIEAPQVEAPHGPPGSNTSDGSLPEAPQDPTLFKRVSPDVPPPPEPPQETPKGPPSPPASDGGPLIPAGGAIPSRIASEMIHQSLGNELKPKSATERFSNLSMGRNRYVTQAAPPPENDQIISPLDRNSPAAPAGTNANKAQPYVLPGAFTSFKGNSSSSQTASRAAAVAAAIIASEQGDQVVVASDCLAEEPGQVRGKFALLGDLPPIKK